MSKVSSSFDTVSSLRTCLHPCRVIFGQINSHICVSNLNRPDTDKFHRFLCILQHDISLFLNLALLVDGVSLASKNLASLVGRWHFIISFLSSVLNWAYDDVKDVTRLSMAIYGSFSSARLNSVLYLGHPCFSFMVKNHATTRT